MNAKEFSVKLATYYREPLLIDTKPNVRLLAIEQWILKESFNEQQLSVMFDEIIMGFRPTGINPFPLIPHIIDICEIETTDKSKAELARTVADNIIHAAINIGCGEDGCKERAKAYIGRLGIDVVKRIYGKWRITCNYIQNGNLETIRAQLRDSIVAHINRTEKGIADQPAELDDLKINSYRTGEITKISDIIGKKALVFE